MENQDIYDISKDDIRCNFLPPMTGLYMCFSLKIKAFITKILGENLLFQ